MAVINNYFQLLFNYFQISYELQLSKNTLDNQIAAKCFLIFVNSYIIIRCIQYMKS